MILRNFRTADLETEMGASEIESSDALEVLLGSSPIYSRLDTFDTIYVVGPESESDRILKARRLSFVTDNTYLNPNIFWGPTFLNEIKTVPLTTSAAIYVPFPHLEITQLAIMSNPNEEGHMGFIIGFIKGIEYVQAEVYNPTQKRFEPLSLTRHHGRNYPSVRVVPGGRYKFDTAEGIINFTLPLESEVKLAGLD